ncbi:MAG: 2-C-methyl-D-erythritol 4-phosphate cytidylyltransferase, partial [Planctomycetota bacterium]|nr:2-C-methyl-D-erythritol 4-phosphate cytidylyltransferase [Planctomycetota bacterium]
EEAAAEDVDPIDAILGGGGGGAGSGGATEGLRVIEGTVAREGVMVVQTPQVFEAALLRRAYGQKDLSSTDDAGLVERLGERVVVVEGDIRNIKLTRPGDVRVLMQVMGLREEGGRPVHKRF